MSARKFRNVLDNVLEFFLIFTFIQGGISLFFYNPLVELEDTLMTRIFGSQIALISYAVVFLFCGLLLLFAKWRRKKNLKKFSLFLSYLVILFTVLLEIVLVGLDTAVIDNVVLSLIAGYCWLSWKMKIDYIDPNQFQKEMDQLRKES